MSSGVKGNTMASGLTCVRAVAAFAVAALLLGAGAAHAEQSRTRVLVIGDSISHGYGGDWTWRYWLAREFKRQGVPADFVGPSRTPSGGTRYEREGSWDSDHGALAGATTEYFSPLIRGLLADYRPDVLILELGINDVFHGDPAEVVILQLQQLINSVRLERQDLPIVLAELPNTGQAQRDATSARVNQAMTLWAATGAVTLVHNRTGEGSETPLWSPVRHTFDGVHPNATGQTLLAHRVGQALHRAGILPANVSAVYRERDWAPDARPDVLSRGRLLEVRWSKARAEISFQAVRVLVDGVPRTGWLPGGDAARGVLLTTTPGTHRIQLVPKRGSMIGSAGTAVFIRVF